MCIVLRGGSSSNEGVDLHNDEFEPAAPQPNAPTRDGGSPFSDFVLDQSARAMANPVGRPAFDTSRIPLGRSIAIATTTTTIDPSHSHRLPNFMITKGCTKPFHWPLTINN
jgi:hypothetical protein